MKRFCSLLLLLVLLTSLPAQAAPWFDDGETLHLDPFCMEAAFSFESYYTPAVEFATVDDARAHGTVCEYCTALFAQDADDPVIWYYNPDGGRYYHRDAECVSVSKAYTPMTGVIVAEQPDWQPENVCNICGSSRQQLLGPSDYFAWEATPAEKAALLPGVWTKPSEQAIHYSAAANAAYEYLLTLRPKEVYAMSVAHYDQDIPGQPRETYKVIALTMLGRPVAVVYVDALTGEVYHHQLAAEYAK